VYLEAGGTKFWSLVRDGSSTTVRYGKIGSDGREQVKDHGDEEKAQKFAAKMEKAKRKKGYADSTSGASPAPAPAPAPAKKRSAASAKQAASKKAKTSDTQNPGRYEMATKFWEISLDGCETIVTYGKIGSEGREQVKDHGDEETAQKFVNKNVKAKVKKGYSLALPGDSKAKAAVKKLSKQKKLTKMAQVKQLKAVDQLNTIADAVAGEDAEGSLNNEDGHVSFWTYGDFKIFQWGCGGTTVGGVCEGSESAMIVENSDGEFYAKKDTFEGLAKELTKLKNAGKFPV